MPIMNAWYEPWSAMANVVLAVIALLLLFQGQNDRRKDRKARERDQASRVSVAVIENNVKISEFGYSRESRVIRLRNDSDLPISYSGSVFLYVNKEWNSKDSTLHSPSDENYRSIETGESSLRPHEETELVDTHHEWDYAVFEFEDSNGWSWARATNTGGLYRLNDDLSWYQRCYQRLESLPLLQYPLQVLPSWMIRCSIKRMPQNSFRVPASARLLRLLRGSMPIGEMSPWETPQNFDARDWPYYSQWEITRDSPDASISRSSHSIVSRFVWVAWVLVGFLLLTGGGTAAIATFVVGLLVLGLRSWLHSRNKSS